VSPYNRHRFWIGFLALVSTTVPATPLFTDANWVGLGGLQGANGSVLSTVSDGHGSIYAAGSFSGIGTVLANHVAQWNGTNWIALGEGMNAAVLALAMDKSGNLYAGGSFTNAGGLRLAGWRYGMVWRGRPLV